MKNLLKYIKTYKVHAILAPTFKLLEALLELFIPLIVASIIDKGIGNNDVSYIIIMVIVMITSGLIGLIFSIIGQYFSAKTAVGSATKLRYDLFKKIQTLTFTDIDKLGTSSMITRMTSDINQVQTGINLTLRLFLRSPFVVFGAAIFASIVAPSLSLIFIITIPVLSIIIFGIMLVTMPMHKKTQEHLDKVVLSTKENLTGVRVIRAFTKEDEEIEEYNTYTKNYEKRQNKVGYVSNLMNPLTYIIINVAIILLIYVGALKVEIGLLGQGIVIAVYNYMSQILVELIKLANLIITITKSLSSSKRIFSILEMNSSVNIEECERKENLPYIVFDNVSMIYEGDLENTLEDISFTVNKGEVIGIIGGTGSGKTSLVNLLTRFYEVGSGNLYFNGMSIKGYSPEYLREEVGVVLQKAILFKGTIRDNIKWGKSDATDEEILEAIKVAECIDVIKSKELGLDEMIEQGGKNLSGGQRQRLSIARSLVKKPSILIFDDSSSALDYATDKRLRENLQNLDYQPTIFIVSQRTASIEHADKIVVLDNGQMVGFDTHENLLLNCKVYQEIYNSQFMKGGSSNE